MFIIKHKSILVDVFTYDLTSFNSNYPDNAISFIPAWWKDLPKTFKDSGFPSIEIPTMKKCMGLIDLYKKGLIFCIDKDIEITSNSATMIDLNLPWAVREKSGVNFVTILPVYNLQDMNNNISLRNVVGEFSTTKELELDISVNKKSLSDPKKIIARKTPIAHLIPLSDRPVSITKHIVNETEYRKLLYNDRKHAS